MLSGPERRPLHWVIEANELGLALNVLVAGAERATLPAAAWSELNAAVEEMRIGKSDPVHGTSARWVVERRPT